MIEDHSLTIDDEDEDYDDHMRHLLDNQGPDQEYSEKNSRARAKNNYVKNYQAFNVGPRLATSAVNGRRNESNQKRKIGPKVL